MKDIRIFIASSRELVRERNALAFLVLAHEEAFAARGLRVRLAKWEYVDPKMTEARTEDRYLDEMYASDAAFVLFRNIAGMYTREELDKALAAEKAGTVRLKAHEILFAAGFADAAKSAWDEGLALERWRKVERWKRWSSVNSADCFREKAAAFQGFAADPAARLRMLRAEHGRWWTERLLAGWKPCPKPADKDGREAAKAAFMHWDMVPFDQLDDFTKELDRVPLAAMAALGFVSNTIQGFGVCPIENSDWFKAPLTFRLAREGATAPRQGNGRGALRASAPWPTPH